MDTEERVGREIAELLKDGRKVVDVCDALKRMNAIGAGTYFLKEFYKAFNDKTKQFVSVEAEAKAVKNI